jgi:hypothetical protein
MRRVAVVSLVGLLMALTGPAVAGHASTTSSLSGRFALDWPRPADQPRNAPCEADTLCGSGRLTDFGHATITIESDDFFERDDCLGVDRVERIHLVDGAGDLVLVSTGEVCFPGRSGDAADQGSYGNPSKWTFATTVDGADSTGIFAGAVGRGAEQFSFAGAIGRWALSGSVTVG